jgi:pantothenate synthetase
VKNGEITKSNLQIHYNPHKNSNDILHRNTQNNPNIHMKAQKTLSSQSNFEQNQLEVSQYQTLNYYREIDKNSMVLALNKTNM